MENHRQTWETHEHIGETMEKLWKPWKTIGNHKNMETMEKYGTLR